MGCAGSSSTASGTPPPELRRRRLSVGRVDATTLEPEDEAPPPADAAEDSRGLLIALGGQTILELLELAGDASGGKMSVGSNTDEGSASFVNKAIQQLGDDVDHVSRGLGYTCRKGLKPEIPNQDSWLVLKLDSHSIYAVFDGHGNRGHDVSNFVKDNLPKLIVKDPRFRTADMPAMLRDVFARTQGLLAEADRSRRLSAKMSGTTATVCVHDHRNRRLTIANVAGSTAVLGRTRTGTKEVEGLPLTRDHTPNLKEERARIEKAGGRVMFDGYASHRVYAQQAAYPGLKMSRCLGDLRGHEDCGLSSEPEVSERDLTPEDTHLLVCSDGVWEFITPTEAVRIVAAFPASQAMAAADRLAKEAWDRWFREEGGAVVDDITAVLVYLPGGREE